MYSFEYLLPTSLQEAGALLETHDEAKLLAGGMSLLSAMKLRLNRPSHLVDLRCVPGIQGIRVEPDAVVIGAMTRHADVAASVDVRRAIPALADLAGGIGDRQVRNRGTMGGSVANSDPAACYPAAVVGLGALIVTTSRQIAADDFFTGLFETALQPGEILVEIRFPRPKRAAYVKYAQAASRFATVGVMAAQQHNGEVRIGVTGAKAWAYRERRIEALLKQEMAPARVRAAELDEDGYNGDLHADALYRRHLVTEIAARAVEKMMAQGQPGQA